VISAKVGGNHLITFLL